MSLDPRAVESLLAFWTASGVDALYADGPVDRTVAVPGPAPAGPAVRVAPGSKPAPARGVPARPAPSAPPRPAPPAPTARAAPPPLIDSDVIALGRTLAAAAPDLTALAAAIAAFDGCEL